MLPSDIRAELKELQPSGISSEEAPMEGWGLYPQGIAIDPSGTTFEDDPDAIQQYYFFQLLLRKYLNRIHSQLYHPSRQRPTGESLLNVLDDVLLNGLEQYRRAFTPRAWNDDEGPAGDILAARLRAKFYGARNIALRPLLEDIMKEEFKLVNDAQQGQFAGSPNQGTSRSLPQSPAITHHKNNQRAARQQYEKKFREHHTFSQSMNHVQVPPLNRRERELAEIGIKSLISSTIAFDAVQNEENRLIVTSVFGTLHA